MHPRQTGDPFFSEAGNVAVETHLEMWSIKDVSKAFKMGERTVWRLVSAGKFPAPIRIGGSSRWRRQSLEQWLEGKEKGWKLKEAVDSRR